MKCRRRRIVGQGDNSRKACGLPDLDAQFGWEGRELRKLVCDLELRHRESGVSCLASTLRKDEAQCEVLGSRLFCKDSSWSTSAPDIGQRFFLVV